MKASRLTTHDGPRPARGPLVAWGAGALALALLGGAMAWWNLETVAPEASPRLVSARAHRAEAGTLHNSEAPISALSGPGPLAIYRRASSAADGEADPTRREELLQQAVAALSFAQYPEVVTALSGPEESAAALRARLLRAWADHEPRAMAEWMARCSQSSLREEALGALALGWAERDFSGGIAWARTLPADTERELALRELAEEAVRSRPREALQLAATLAPGERRDEVLRRAAAEWAAQDAPRAAEWARQLPAGALRERLLGSIAITLAETNPAAAANLALDELPAGRAQADAVISILQRWTQQAPAPAAAWAAQFPAGELRHAAIENVAAQWSASAPTAAAEWRARMMEP